MYEIEGMNFWEEAIWNCAKIHSKWDMNKKILHWNWLRGAAEFDREVIKCSSHSIRTASRKSFEQV